MIMKIVISRLFSMLLFATVVITSCSKETELQVVKGYKVNIRATNNSGTKAINEVDLGDGKFKAVTTFSNTEEIYFCNLSDGNKIDATAINPTPDGGDAHNARIVGDLSGATSSSVTISYAVDNNLRLLYNTPATGIVDYASQDGAFANLIIAATADVTITGTGASGKEITASNATFSNLQSIFKFSFKIGSTDTYLGKSVRFVRIFSTQGKLLSQYNAVTGSSTYGPVTISRDTDLPSNYVYAALRFDANSGDEIVFQVVTNDGKVYSGSKTAPTAGFENGKFYTSTVTVNLYTFTASSNGQKVCFSPGDLGVDNGVYSFTEPFTAWNQSSTNMTSSTAPSKRTWFIKSEVQNGQTVYGIAWRIQNYASEWKYLVGIDAGRTIDNGNVQLYYKVHINTTELGDRYWCYLLPPDQATADDIKEDLKNYKEGTNYYEVTDYLKYIAKGFVLLMDTEYSYRISTSGKWTYKSRSDKHSGYYQAGYVNSSKTYFDFGANGPNYNSPGNGHDYRIHTRYIHNVTVSTP